MKQLATIIALALAPAGWEAVQSLSFPILTGIALTMFSGLFIFSVMAAQSPNRWKPSIQLTPNQKEHLNNVVQLTGVMTLFAATAVVLIALADDGLTVMDVIRILMDV